jgi:hypothetical protein
MQKPYRALVLFCILAVTTAFLPAVSAEDKSDFDGAALFRGMCASCHGLTGTGDGPVAGALKVPMKPLATLAKRHGGEFPERYVYGVIDSSSERFDLSVHGDHLMPVWGNYFRQKHEGEGVEESTNLRIQALVDYIKSMQTN